MTKREQLIADHLLCLNEVLDLIRAGLKEASHVGWCIKYGVPQSDDVAFHLLIEHELAKLNKEEEQS